MASPSRSGSVARISRSDPFSASAIACGGGDSGGSCGGARGAIRGFLGDDGAGVCVCVSRCCSKHYVNVAAPRIILINARISRHHIHTHTSIPFGCIPSFNPGIRIPTPEPTPGSVDPLNLAMAYQSP
eukprot:7395318-Pyramimonas_sp.AAC.2